MLDFGDNVRIKASPEAEALGIAGRLGSFYGFTTPSVSGIAVVGSKAEDLAYSISIEEMNRQSERVREIMNQRKQGQLSPQ